MTSTPRILSAGSYHLCISRRACRRILPIAFQIESTLSRAVPVLQNKETLSRRTNVIKTILCCATRYMCLVCRSYHLSLQKHVSAIVHRAIMGFPAGSSRGHCECAQKLITMIFTLRRARAQVWRVVFRLFFCHEASQVISSFSCTVYTYWVSQAGTAGTHMESGDRCFWTVLSCGYG